MAIDNGYLEGVSLHKGVCGKTLNILYKISVSSYLYSLHSNI